MEVEFWELKSGNFVAVWEYWTPGISARKQVLTVPKPLPPVLSYILLT